MAFIPDKPKVKATPSFVSDAYASPQIKTESLPSGEMSNVDQQQLAGFAGNVVKSGAAAAQNTVQAFKNPGETLDTLEDVVIGGIAKLLPDFPGPKSGSMDMEKAKFDAVVNMYKERYGGMENAKKTLYEDPVGAANDLSAVLGIGAGALQKAGLLTKIAGMTKTASALEKTAGVVKTASEVTNPMSGALKVAGKGTEVAAGGVSKAAKWLSEREIQSLIKPPIKTLTYGKNPMRGVLDEGIVATSKNDLYEKIAARRSEVGRAIGEAIADKKYAKVKLDVTDATKAIDDAIVEASKMKNTNQALIGRLKGIKADIQKGRKLKSLSPTEAQELKRNIGDITKYTGNVSDDTLVNEALQKAYRTIDRKIDSAIPNVQRLNERYANLSGAYVSAKHNAEIAGRRNILGIGEMVAGGSAALAGMAGGPAEAGLYGLGGALAYKTLGSAPFKTAAGQVLNAGSKVAGNVSDMGGILAEAAPRAAVPYNTTFQLGRALAETKKRKK